MLHTETVEPSTMDLLKRLQRLPDLSNIRLVGGTALALHLGHRKSVDLDEGGIKLAGLKDIAAMKLSAVANRGRKKDFIDVARLLDLFTLEEMLAFYKSKFSVSEVSFTLRGLMYFDDAEEDPMPEMFDGNLTWENVKKKIIDTTRAFVLRGNV